MAPKQIPLECFCCGAANPWQVKPVDFVAPFRETEHSFIALVNQCRSCDAISPSSEQTDAISAQVREEHVRWISQELTKAREELGLTIDGFVNQTGMARATVARASSGESLIDASTEKMLWHAIERLRNHRNIRIWTGMVPHENGRSRELAVVSANRMHENQAPYSTLLKKTPHLWRASSSTPSKREMPLEISAIA